MLNQPTLEKLQAMKLHGMAESFREQIEEPTPVSSVSKNTSAYWSTVSGPGKKLAHSRGGCNWPGSRSAA